MRIAPLNSLNSGADSFFSPYKRILYKDFSPLETAELWLEVERT